MRHAKPPIKRLHLIHLELKAGKHPNTVSLSEKLEVSRRTILRDVEYLRDQMSAPIEYDPEKRGFYYTEPSYMFPSIPISERELIAVFIAEKALAQYKGTPYEKALKSAFHKIVSSLPEEVSISLSDVDETYSFRTSAVTVQDIEIFKKLSNAAIKKRQIEIRYYTQYRDEVTTRVVDPYHLVNLNGEWYLLAYCHYRNEIRTFMPSRIRSIRETGARFKVDESFEASKFLGFTFGIFTGREKYAIRMKFDGFASRYIKEKIWHQSQTLEELEDGTVILTLRLNSLVEIKRWILSWGEHVEALEPPALVKELSDTAGWYSKKYLKRNT
ncbi:MAG: WYL domain-containing transcriptional regulator [bacterium]